MKKNAFTNFINDYKTWIEDVKKSDKKIKMVIPNILTASRLLSPFLILPATLLGNFPLATAFAATFALTDAFDGFLARKWETTSEFGKNLDPITDKFFVLGISIPFLNNPTMIITLILEGIIGSINLKSAFKNNKPKSTYIGKGKTVLLSTLITLSYLFKMKGISLDALLPLFIITNTVQVITAVDYARIDDKKDFQKEVSTESKTNEEDEKEQDDKISKIKQDLIAYRHLRSSLTKEETIEQEKKRHFNL